AGSTAVLSSTTIPNPTFVADVYGTYTATLTVNDGHGNTAMASVLISTNNTPPVAKIAASSNAVVGQPLTLDGTGSTDADGDTLTFQWSLTSAPAGSTAAIVNPTLPMASFTPDVFGNFGVQLKVTDSAGYSSTAQTTLASNTTPVANAGPAQSFTTVPTLIHLDGSASTDIDGDTITYQWAIISTP